MRNVPARECALLRLQEIKMLQGKGGERRKDRKTRLLKRGFNFLPTCFAKDEHVNYS
jgi:hypothetical protein